MVPCWLVFCLYIQNVMHMLMTWELTCSRDNCTGYQVTKKMVNCVPEAARYTMVHTRYTIPIFEKL
jgi:hypothetical protein